MIKQAYEKGFIDGLTKLGVDAGMAQELFRALKLLAGPAAGGIAGTALAPEGQGWLGALGGTAAGAALGGGARALLRSAASREGLLKEMLGRQTYGNLGYDAFRRAGGI